MSRKPVKEGPFDLFMRAWATGSPRDAILGQEAAGQQSFVGSDTLPTDMRDGARAVLEAAGVKFLRVVEDDPMFQYVELPEGWKKVATDHPRWSRLVDEKGRIRAEIFYKASFYDRSAFLVVNRRFNISIDYDKLHEEGVAVAMVTDGQEIIFTTSPIKFEGEGQYQAEDEARRLAKEWLDKHYPDWENAAAYWD